MCRAISENGGRRCTGTHTTAQHTASLAHRRAVYLAGVMDAAHVNPVYAPDPVYIPAEGPLTRDQYEQALKDLQVASGEDWHWRYEDRRAYAAAVDTLLDRIEGSNGAPRTLWADHLGRVFGVVVLDTDSDEAVLKANSASLSADPTAHADNVDIGKARILAGTSAAHSVLGSYRNGVRCVVCREMVSPAYGAPDDHGFVCEHCADKNVRDAEFANGQTPVDDDWRFGTLTFSPDGQPQLVEAPQLVGADDDETEDATEAAAEAARLAETAADDAHKVLSDAEMEADDAAWAAEEAARVYDPPVAGLHSPTDVMGSRMRAADRAWSRQIDTPPWQGWTLLDEGETSGSGIHFAPVSGEPVLGFRDQQGGEWVAVGHGSERDPDGIYMSTPATWEITEVTGRYEAGLKDANGGYRMSNQHSFHRGPERATSPASVKVAAELGDRWTPAYMTSYMTNNADPRYGDDGWWPAETITLYSESGHVLATKKNIYSDSGSKNGQAGVGLKLARKAGWTDVLNIRVKDATSTPHDGARIPVSVKTAEGFADWLGDNNATALPTMEWLNEDGLKAVAGCAAVGRQLMGPVGRVA